MVAVYTIPGGTPFLPTLARWWVTLDENRSDLRSDIIYTPNKRAERALRLTLLDQLAQMPPTAGAWLFPRISPIAEEDMLEKAQQQAALSSKLPDEPWLKEIDPVTRTLLQARPLKSWLDSVGGPDEKAHPWSKMRMSQVYELAQEITALWDKFLYSDVSHEAIKDCVEEKYTENWRLSFEFFDQVLLRFWPAMMAEQNLQEKITLEQELMQRRGESWVDETTRPYRNIVLAGITGRQKSVVDMLDKLQDARGVHLVLHNLDLELYQDQEQRQQVIASPLSPQHVMFRMLDRLNVESHNITPIGADPDTSRFARAVMAPSEKFNQLELPITASNVSCHTFRNESEEALAIAIWLRETAQDPKARAMCVTPSLKLARRVANILERWQLKVPIGVSQPLSSFPACQFVLEVAALFAKPPSPEQVVSLLKNRMSFLNDAERQTLLPQYEALLRKLPVGSSCKDAAHEARINANEARKSKDDPLADFADFADFAEKIALLLEPPSNKRDETLALGEWIGELLALVTKLTAPENPTASAEENPAENPAASAPEKPAENPAATKDFFDQSEVARSLLKELKKLEKIDRQLLELRGNELEDFLARILKGVVANDGANPHPRIEILGVIESRLMHADRVILGGFSEGIWPSHENDGPWISNEMRKRLGLELADVSVGLMAHEVEALMMSRQVFLTHASMRDRQPQVPSRWWVRLLCLNPAAEESAATDDNNKSLVKSWLNSLSAPDNPYGIQKPRPQGRSLAERSRRFYVKDIRHLANNNFSYFAKQVLRLSPCESLRKEVTARELGNIIHKQFEEMVKEVIPNKPPELWGEILQARFRQKLDEQFKHEANFVFALRQNYFDSLSNSFAARMKEVIAESKTFDTEKTLSQEIATPMGPVTIKGIADRIDHLTVVKDRDGKAAKLRIIDYKSGDAPTVAKVTSGIEPQMSVLRYLALGDLKAASSAKDKLDAANSNLVEACFWGINKHHGTINPTLCEIKEKRGKGEDPLLPEDEFAAFFDKLTLFLGHYAYDAKMIFSPSDSDIYDDYADFNRRREWSLYASQDEEE